MGGTLYFAATGRPPRLDDRLPEPDEQVDLSMLPPDLRDLVGRCMDPTRSRRPRATDLFKELRGMLRAPSFEAALPPAIVEALRTVGPPGSAPPLPVASVADRRIPTARLPRPASSGFVSHRPPTQRPSSELWRKRLGDRVLAVNELSAGRVLAVAGDGTVTAWSERDGTEEWHIRLPVQATGCVAVVGGRVHVGAGENLYVLDVDTGHRLEVLGVGGMISSCVVLGKWVVAATRSGTLAAFDEATGRHAWDDELPAQLSSGLAATRDAVYAGGADGIVYARTARLDGLLLGSHSIGQRIHALAVSARGLHVGGADGGMISLDRRGLRTSLRTPPHDGQVWACDSDPGTSLVATASVDGRVRVDDIATGGGPLVEQHGSPVRRSLTLHGNLVVTGHVDGSLIVREARSGAHILVYDGPGAIDVPAVVTASQTVVGGWADGTVAALAMP